MKPDFIVLVSGEQRDIAVGEIKPPSNSTATNLGESDKLKLGRMMKEIYNDLVARGVTNPVVGGILVEGETMKTFVMRLEFARIYELVEVSRTPIFQSIKTLTSLPTLVSDLMTLKVKLFWLSLFYVFY